MLMIGLAMLALAQDAGAQPCSLTEADRINNRTLAFGAFDQNGVTEATAQKLAARGCYREAAAATEDYLLYGPVQREREASAIAWHLGQYLALSGDEAAGAHVLATTQRPPEPTPDNLDWNSYVRGTHAFLIKDRPGLDTAASQLGSREGRRNQINARMLRRLQTCFDRPYREAFSSEACAVE